MIAKEIGMGVRSKIRFKFHKLARFLNGAPSIILASSSIRPANLTRRPCRHNDFTNVLANKETALL